MLLVAAGLAVALSACSAGQEAQTAFISPNVEGANGDVDDIALRNVTIAYPEGGRYARGADARLQFIVVNSGEQDDALVEVRTDAAERVTIGAGQQASGSATPSGTASGSSPATGSATPSQTGSATPSSTGTSAPAGSPSPTGTPSGSATPTTSGSSGPASPSGSAGASPSGSAAAPSGAAGQIKVPAGGYVACRDSGPAVTLVGLTRPLLPAEIVSFTFAFENAGEIAVDVPVAVPLTEVSPPPTIDIQGTEGGG